MERYYTVNEIAELFKVTRTTVYEWMNTGKLEWVQVGARRRVTQSALDRFVKTGREAAPPADEVQSEDIRRSGLVGALKLAH